MARYALTFSKTGAAIYTSHLDTMRLFQRAFQRAEVPIAFSQGFNPHPKMSFAQPLPLGYQGLAELLEFQIEQEREEASIRAQLNPVLPAGVEVSRCTRLPDHGPSLAALCQAAEYDIRFPIGSTVQMENITQLHTFLAQPSITVEKRKKRGRGANIAETMEIRDKIRQIEGTISDNIYIMSTILDTGSQSHLSPTYLVQAFFDFYHLDVPPESVAITRIQLLLRKAEQPL